VGQVVNWVPISDFKNLEELRIHVWSTEQPLPHLLLRSVTSSGLRRVIIVKEETGDTHWLALGEDLVNLAKRQKVGRNLVLQLSTKAGPERIRGMLPWTVQEGVLEVGVSKRPDYCA
jgi:hypothetical protein